MNDFEQAGIIYLAGSKNSLKSVIDGKEHFVAVKDIYQALNNPKFHAPITRLVRPSIEQKTRQIELKFSVILSETGEGVT